MAGLKPAAAGFSGGRGAKEELEAEGKRGTVGKPGGGEKHGTSGTKMQSGPNIQLAK